MTMREDDETVGNWKEKGRLRWGEMGRERYN
jgi:hypothetical protein